LIQPNQFGLLANLGLQYQRLNDKEKALYYYNRSLEQNPDCYDTLINKANLLLVMDDAAAALEVSEKLLAIDPQDASGYRIRANALSELGLYEQAVEQLLKAMELDPMDKA